MPGRDQVFLGFGLLAAVDGADGVGAVTDEDAGLGQRPITRLRAGVKRLVNPFGYIFNMLHVLFS